MKKKNRRTLKRLLKQANETTGKREFPILSAKRLLGQDYKQGKLSLPSKKPRKHKKKCALSSQIPSTILGRKCTAC